MGGLCPPAFLLHHFSRDVHGSHGTPFWDSSGRVQSGSEACWEWAEGHRT